MTDKSNGNQDVKLSQLIIDDMTYIVQELQDNSEYAILLSLSLSFLRAAFPVVLYFEQSGKSIEAADLVDLNRLEILNERINTGKEDYFSTVSNDLCDYLLKIPGYDVFHVGEQKDRVYDHHKYVMQFAKNLNLNYRQTNISLSSVLFKDIKSIINKLNKAGKDNSCHWRLRSLYFVRSALPVVLFLEQVGQKVMAQELHEIHKLESLVENAKEKYGDLFAHLSQDLCAYMNNLPDYQPSKKGQQSASTDEHHKYIIMSARELSTAS